MNPIGPDIAIHLAIPGSPSLTPDGRRLVFTSAHIDPKTITNSSRLLSLSLLTGSIHELTQGPYDRAPLVSPDGLTVGFLRPDAKEKSQIWLIHLDSAEIQQITDMPEGVSEFTWAPDSKSIAFICVQKEEWDRFENEKDLPKVRIVNRIRYRGDTVGWLGDTHRHLFSISIETKSVNQLTFGDGDEMGPVYSPDSSQIAYISDNRDDRDITPYADAYVIPSDGGLPELWSDGLASVSRIAWSPNGESLVVIGSKDSQLIPGWQGWLFVLKLNELPSQITSDIINPSGGFLPVILPPVIQWGLNGKIYFIGDRRGESYLCSVDHNGENFSMLGPGDAQFTGVSFAEDSSLAVVSVSTSTSPGELYMINLKDGTYEQLTRNNEEYFRAHPPAIKEKLVVHRGEFDIECRLYMPYDYDPSKQYPLILDIHGGPHGVFMDAFNATQQVLASAGYMVLCPNPRGSSTYGASFAKAVIGHWGEEDYRDIMEVLEQVAERSDVDSKRVGVHGYSYGGYMTCWIVGQNSRFLAAVAGAAVTDLSGMYGTSDIGVSFGEVQWGGIRGANQNEWEARSPISYVRDVETPILLLHGELDHRVPIEQSESFFVALKRLNKEVQLIRFPGCYHSFLRFGHPRMREEYLSRVLAWFDYYLG